MHELNEELQLCEEGNVECTLCGAECENIIHVLWEYLASSNCGLTFLRKLSGYSDFDSP